MIKLLICDVDGTLTDSTCGVSENGELFKKFSHRDGRGFHLLKEKTNIKTMWVTSEKGGINAARAGKLVKLRTLHYYADGAWNLGKVQKAESIMREIGISWEEVAFIGDDTNDLDIMKKAKYTACPADAVDEIREEADFHCKNKSGHGAVREFIDEIIKAKLYEDKNNS